MKKLIYPLLTALLVLIFLTNLPKWTNQSTPNVERTTELKVAPEDVYMTRLVHKGLTLECANLGYLSISCNWEAWNKLREPDAEGFYPPEPTEDPIHRKSSTALTVGNLYL